MKHIVIFGAGKSSAFLIEYLLNQLSANEWRLTVADGNPLAAQSRIAGVPNAMGVALNVENELQRKQLIGDADIVISLLPPSLHYLIAVDCITMRKNLLTASYADQKTKLLEPQIRNRGMLFLCEMGLDPGIDHMSAMSLIHRLRGKGAVINTFRSYCGGLVAPESDDNPWHYKISWNPRNIVLAGKQGAHFKENNIKRSIARKQLFDPDRQVNIPGLGNLSWYPNRDSLEYIKKYDLNEASTFVRATLRHPAFCFAWNSVVQLQLTSENITYNTDGLTLKQFFSEHLYKYGSHAGIPLEFIGNDRKFNLMSPAWKQLITQLLFLGLDDDATLINKGRCTAADVLQFAMEKKLVLDPGDRDMIVMLHQIGYELDGDIKTITSCLLQKGENNLRTAMAKTVGLPLGIATKMILQGKIKATGLCIPVKPEIYGPVLNELNEHGISFSENNV